jgi:cytochrome b
MSKQTKNVRVWDLPTRAFHWVLASCVVASIISARIGGNAMIWHFRLGYVVFALLVFRVLWGLMGGRWSRFANFVRGPGTIWRYLHGKNEPHEHHDVGHNPLGALSVLGLLGILAIQVATGLVADDEISNTGPLIKFVSGSTSLALTRWHQNVGQWLIMAMVALHVAAILFYLLKKKRNLIHPMLTGDKELDASTPASADNFKTRALGLALLAASIGLVVWVIGLGE